MRWIISVFIYSSSKFHDRIISMHFNFYEFLITTQLLSIYCTAISPVSLFACTIHNTLADIVLLLNHSTDCKSMSISVILLILEIHLACLCSHFNILRDSIYYFMKNWMRSFPILNFLGPSNLALLNSSFMSIFYW